MVSPICSSEERFVTRPPALPAALTHQAALRSLWAITGNGGEHQAQDTSNRWGADDESS
jgi:hypothetical protein